MREEVKRVVKDNTVRFAHLAKTYFGFSETLCTKARKEFERDNYRQLNDLVVHGGSDEMRKRFYRVNVNFLRKNYHRYKPS